MSAEIVSPFGMSAAPTPNEDIVARLRSLLEKAERGEINGVVYGYTRPTGGISYGFCAGTANCNLLTAAVSMAWHDFMAETAKVAKDGDL